MEHWWWWRKHGIDKYTEITLFTFITGFFHLVAFCLNFHSIAGQRYQRAASESSGTLRVGETEQASRLGKTRRSNDRTPGDHDHHRHHAPTDNHDAKWQSFLRVASVTDTEAKQTVPVTSLQSRSVPSSRGGRLTDHVVRIWNLIQTSNSKLHRLPLLLNFLLYYICLQYWSTVYTYSGSHDGIPNKTLLCFYHGLAIAMTTPWLAKKKWQESNRHSAGLYKATRNHHVKEKP